MARELPSMMPSMNKPEVWEAWEGQWVGGKYPLRVWLGGSEQSAVFATEIAGPKSQKAAVKLIPADAPHADGALARWGRAAKLSHPNLLRVLGMGRCQLGDAPLLYLVLEYAEEDLSQILPTRPLTPDETKELLFPVLDALSYLHRQGLVHGHIQPSNLMAAGNQLKLSVDRLCAVGESSDRAKAPNAYDAPEVSTGTMSPAADLWALGVTLVEALTQKLPTLAAKTQSDPVIPAGISEPFLGICRDCLRRGPEQRSTIDDITVRLGLAVPVESAAPAAVGRSEEKPPDAMKRSDWRIVVPVAAALLLATALIGHRLLPRHEAGPPAPTASAVDHAAPVESAPTPVAPAKSKPAAPPAKTNDSRGAVVRQVLPEVPRSARNTITGKVRVSVRVDVDPSGKVTAAKLAAPANSQYFARLALKAAQSWEFAPPQASGQPTSSAWILRFRFGRASTEVSPTQLDH
jgi:TonB family protein